MELILKKQATTKSTDDINLKDRYSFNFKYCFMDIVVKWPASVHDARVFSNSSINSSLKSGKIPPCKRLLLLDENPIPIFILGDPAYPLMPYSMMVYSNVVLLHKNNILE